MTANYISSITVDQVIDALQSFMQPFMQGGLVVRGQTNRVALPSSPCAVLTELFQDDLDIPYMNYDGNAGTTTISGPTKIDIQIDFYGISAGELCRVIKSAFRSQWAYDQFPANIRPLYTDQGRQAPLITGEEQYETRWILTASLQYNPTVSLPQQSADQLAVAATVDVDL